MVGATSMSSYLPNLNSTHVNYQECSKNLHFIDQLAISMSIIHPTGTEALPFNGQVIVFRCIYSKHGSIVQVAKYQPFAKFSIIQLFFSCGPLTSRISCQTEEKNRYPEQVAHFFCSLQCGSFSV